MLSRLILFYYFLCLLETKRVLSLIEFDCPPYSVSGDSKASVEKSVVCPIWACPGQTIEASMCGNSYGDNFLRLFDNNTELTANDDYCGAYGASRVIYTTQFDSVTDCHYFRLLQGCFGAPLCSGVSHVIVSGDEFGHPTAVPSVQPSGSPSSAPTSPTSEPSGEPSGQPSGEPSGIPTTSPPTSQPTATPSNQPSGYPSSIPSFPPSAEPSTQPSTVPSSTPSSQPLSSPSSPPSSAPTCPSSQPTDQPSVQPTSQPSTEPSSLPSGQPTSRPTAYGSTFYCPNYDITGDNRALVNTTVCLLWGCPGQLIEVNLCRHSFGDTYIRLYNTGGTDIVRNDDGGCGQYGGSRLYYQVVDQGNPNCRRYYLEQGCYDEVRCGGASFITVHGDGHPTSVPSNEPTTQPTSAPSSPSSQPSSEPSGQPTNVPSFAPTIISTGEPTGNPTQSPAGLPTSVPSSMPSEVRPTSEPSAAPQVDEVATILISVLLPFSTLLALLGIFYIYRYYQRRYYGRINSNKVRCVSSTNCQNEDILTQIDFFEEF